MALPTERDSLESTATMPAMDGQITVRVSDDRMAAYALVTPPGPGGVPVLFDRALAALGEAGVAFGIDPESVLRAVDEGRNRADGAEPAEPLVVARGRAPVPGVDGQIEYDPALTNRAGRPTVRPDGSVNLADLNLVFNVTEGTVLARRVPPTPGEPGVTVFGQTLPVRAGKEVRLKAGRGTQVGEDGLTLLAIASGHASLMPNGTVVVNSVFQVNGDVGVKTGNIHFVGNVVVRGGVDPGFTVKADGDVEVNGTINCAFVEAGGSLTVLYGIQGGEHHRGHVIAGGSVRARFIENADVQAGGSVWAADGIVQSHVEAGENVEVLGRHGAIIGGRVMAREKVSARILGSDIGTLTELGVGAPPRVRTELQEARQRLQEVAERISKAGAAIQFLEAQAERGPLPPDRQELLTQLTTARTQLEREVEELECRVKELEELLASAETAYVEAQDRCHPGVLVSIGHARHMVRMVMYRTRFRRNRNHEAELVPI